MKTKENVHPVWFKETNCYYIDVLAASPEAARRLGERAVFEGHAEPYEVDCSDGYTFNMTENLGEPSGDEGALTAQDIPAA